MCVFGLFCIFSCHTAHRIFFRHSLYSFFLFNSNDYGLVHSMCSSINSFFGNIVCIYVTSFPRFISKQCKTISLRIIYSDNLHSLSLTHTHMQTRKCTRKLFAFVCINSESILPIISFFPLNKFQYVKYKQLFFSYEKTIRFV